MKPLFRSTAVIATLAAPLLTLAVRPAQALPRQAVVVVAEGLNPQTIDLGVRYINKVQGAAEDNSAISQLRANGKSAPAPADALNSLKGLLATAKASGYKTGLVTTGDVSKVAPLFYNTPEGDAAALVQASPYDFVAGGGRASFSDDVRKGIEAGGNTLLTDGAAFEDTEREFKGKVIALQSDADLSYSIDRLGESEAGWSDLASAAMDNLGANDAPYLLIVHDTLLAKALAAKDAPAALNQLQELDTLVSSAIARREDKGEAFGFALLATGGTINPTFATADLNAQSNALFVVSGLTKSFTGAGQALTGADEERLNDFAENEYAGWKLSPENRAGILAGTLAPEAAVRASYEPVVGINYDTVAAQPTLHVLGFDAADLAAISTMAATQPAAK